MTDTADTKPVTWTVGEEVAFIDPWKRAASATVIIDKVYKTGHVMANGRRYRPWGGRLIQTGDGYRRAELRKLTDETRAQIARTAVVRTIRLCVEWLRTVKYEDMSDEALDAIVKALGPVTHAAGKGKRG